MVHITTQAVPVQNLQVGMFVSRLDIPWVQTPFPIQGFYLTKKEEVDLLSHYCNKVYIDLFLSKVDTSVTLQTSKKILTESDVDKKTARLMNEKARYKPRIQSYPILKKLKKEMKTADLLYQKITSQIANIYRGFDLNGNINISEVRSVSNAMTECIINNPNALAWLSRINKDNKLLHSQSIRSAVWALIFARHLGLAKEDLSDLGCALLLTPIGKSQLSEELLVSQESNQEIQQYQQHISLTLQETEKMFSSSHQVNYIISSYCERNNGSGYPNKLIGNRIPFLARIAGIADYYEQLINPYSQASALSPSEAISHLYNLKGQLFQRELVEDFIQSIGLYPTGSLVELNNSSIGIVVEQPDKSRLRPKVAIIRNKINQILDKPVLVNLADSPKDENNRALQINMSLNSTNYDLETYNIHSKVFGEKGWFSFLTI